MQIFTMNMTGVVWPHVTNLLDLRYFCQHNPLFYHLNLILCHHWSWQRYIYFLVNIFVRHTFSMSKSSIKTKTVLTMTNMAESTELPAFKRQKDGYKVTVKISLCICVVLSWDELKVRQNLLVSDYEMYMVCHISYCSWVLLRCYSERSLCSGEFGCRSFIKLAPWTVCFLPCYVKKLACFYEP